MKNEDENYGKNKMKDMLDRRHKERQLDLNNRHAIRLKDQSSSENQNYFMDIFLEQYQEVERNLNNIQSDDPKSLTKQFNSIAVSIQELQGYLSNSTLFLSDYTIKSAQHRIDSLLVQFDEIKLKFIPKKKFGFRSKEKEQPLVNEKSKEIGNDVSDKTEKCTSPDSNASKHIEWTIKNKSNEEIILQGADVDDKDLTISTMSNCLIQIVGHAGSLQVSHLKNCLILCGPVSRSVFADNCIDCKLVFGCQQFRLHLSKNCDIYMHVTGRAIIEDCTNVSVAPYNYTYPLIEQHFAQCGLNLYKNNWEDVADFNWLAFERHSPNWKPIEIENRITDWQLIMDQFRREFI